jgi:hypothetical protein
VAGAVVVDADEQRLSAGHRGRGDCGGGGRSGRGGGGLTRSGIGPAGLAELGRFGRKQVPRLSSSDDRTAARPWEQRPVPPPAPRRGVPACAAPAPLPCSPAGRPRA